MGFESLRARQPHPPQVSPPTCGFVVSGATTPAGGDKSHPIWSHDAMDFPASRAMSLATAAYGVFALARPGHLPDAMKADPTERRGLITLARGDGVRDLVVSGAALLGGASAVRAAMATRVAFDLSDCVLLLRRTDDPAVRAKVAAATVGWASLNVAALVLDSRRA